MLSRWADSYATLSSPPSLLLVCAGNLCRSPMAAALFTGWAGARGYPLRVASAGVSAPVGLPPPPPVIDLMASRGLDVLAHQARQLTVALAAQHDLVLVMDRSQQRLIQRSWPALKGRVRRLGAWRDEDVPDPYGLANADYESCLACIERCVADWESQLLAARGDRIRLPR